MDNHKHITLNNHIFGYSDTSQHMVKPDGTEFTEDEFFADLEQILKGGKSMPHKMTEPVTKCWLKSSPNANQDTAYITEENLAGYAAMLNELMAKHNIESNFEVKFCGMDGWMVVSSISNEDFNFMILKGLDLSDCADDINEFLCNLYEFNDEEEESSL